MRLDFFKPKPKNKHVNFSLESRKALFFDLEGMISAQKTIQFILGAPDIRKCSLLYKLGQQANV